MPTTLNPSDKGSIVSLSNGNMTCTINSNNYNGVRATKGKGKGKWYWECTIQGNSGGIPGVGIATASATLESYIGSDNYGWGWLSTGVVYKNGLSIANWASYSSGDVLGLAYDADSQTLKGYKNNSLQGTLTSVTGTYPIVACHNTLPYDQITINFGLSVFTYTPPTGYSSFDLTNIMPQQSSDSSPLITSASSVNGGYAAWRAFDRDSGTYWLASNGDSLPGWIKVDFGTITKYTYTGAQLTTVSGGNSVRIQGDFAFQGSTNDSTWVDLLSLTSQSAFGSSEVRDYSWSNSVWYRYFRWIKTAGTGNYDPNIASLEIYGSIYSGKKIRNNIILF